MKEKATLLHYLLKNPKDRGKKQTPHCPYREDNFDFLVCDTVGSWARSGLSVQDLVHQFVQTATGFPEAT